MDWSSGSKVGAALPQCLLELGPALLHISVLGSDTSCQAGLQAEQLGHSHVQHLEDKEQAVSNSSGRSILYIHIHKLFTPIHTAHIFRFFFLNFWANCWA